ncbi:hypothetical protein ACQPZ8_46355 [Actinomadura nitritigenes]|uniref:hypothetical protein n=1 Tax=Actinomadura nitritigenes TaxID=134602 RepID=UPI003D921B13
MSPPARALIGVAGLPVVAILLVLQAMYDSVVLWAAFVAVSFAVFVVGVVAVASAVRPGGSVADAARLDELEPLPSRDEDGR